MIQNDYRLQKGLPNIHNKPYHGFIGRNDILHKTMIVHITMHYPKEFSQELVSTQLESVKACHKVPHWLFIRELTNAMVLELVDTSKELHGGVIEPFPLWESMRQGCASSPLKFAPTTHPIPTRLNL